MSVSRPPVAAEIWVTVPWPLCQIPHAQIAARNVSWKQQLYCFFWLEWLSWLVARDSAPARLREVNSPEPFRSLPQTLISAV
jgi:hypothetical protein